MNRTVDETAPAAHPTVPRDAVDRVAEAPPASVRWRLPTDPPPV